MERATYFEYEFLDAAAPGFADYLVDEDGRPLAEINAPPRVKADVTFTYQRCPYAGTRNGRQMNVSALKQVSSVWESVKDDLLSLRALYMRRFPVPMNYLLLARLAALITAVPCFFVRNAHRPIAFDRVPTRTSALFKAAQGLYMTANDAMLSGEPGVAFEKLSAESFLDYTEHHEIFATGEDRVCSGPPRMVHEFVQLAIEGAERGSSDPWLEAGLRSGDVIAYSEWRLKAQMGQLVYMSRLCDLMTAAPSIFGKPGFKRLEPPLFQSLNKMSGLNVDGLSARDLEGAQLSRVVRGGDPVEARSFGEALVALQRRYLAFIEKIQGPMSDALGRERPRAMNLQTYFEVAAHFDAHGLLAHLVEVVDVNELGAAL